MLDLEKIREEGKYDGYCAIVTSEPDKTVDEIIEICRGLWEIEGSFKVTKSDLEARIRARFLICFTALAIVRILERRLGGMFSVSKIIESLILMSASQPEENLYMFEHADEATEAVNSPQP